MADLHDAPPEIKARVQRLIAAFHPELSQARIRVQVRDVAPVDGGFATYGETDTANDSAEKSAYDFTMWFALDVWARMSELQRDAITVHELCHCGWDEQGQPMLIHHDIEEFNRVIANFGLVWPEDRATLAAFMSMPAPSGLEGIDNMPSYGSYQRPMQGGGHGSTGAFQAAMPGNHGSVGAYQRPMPGGSSGSTGAFQAAMPGGSSGSTGAMAQPVAYSDPHLQQGSDYHTISMADGSVLELCPDCYRTVVGTVLDDLQAALSGGI